MKVILLFMFFVSGQFGGMVNGRETKAEDGEIEQKEGKWSLIFFSLLEHLSGRGKFAIPQGV